MTARCDGCDAPVVPGHTAHDEVVDGIETWWCESCCPRCKRERGHGVKQTIEVEVGPEDDAGTCLVVLGGTRHERWDRATVEVFGLAIPDPAPERTEYPLQRITESQFNGRTVIHDFDEVLVAAHSLRVGDRIEWAPGDWREITQVVMDPVGSVVQYMVDGITASSYRWDLLAVRRS